jgi:hypothetical protein
MRVPVPLPVPVPGPLLPPDPQQVRIYGTVEMQNKTEKVEAFADDNTVLALLERRGIETIKTILADFADLSGLRCNVDKSQILIFGTETVPDFIIESGFAVAEKLKILGFDVTKDFSDLNLNVNPAIENIRKIGTFWNRYRLSLPGRINVAKTLMLSQISFHASIIDVPEEKINEIQLLINNFICGNFRFNKNLICISPAGGGLGMININNFIVSLHCSWLKRAHKEVTDNWRRNLHNIAGGDCTLLDPRILDPDPQGPEPDHNPVPAPEQIPNKYHHPILNTISKSFWKFKNAFLTQGKNFFSSQILGNPRLINNKRERACVNVQHLINFLPDPDKERFKAIRISDFTLDGNTFTTFEQFSVEKNIALDRATFEQLRSYIRDSWMVIKKFSDNDNEIDVTTFITRFKRGSKQFRKSLDSLDLVLIKNKQNRRNNTFFNLLNMQKPENMVLRILNGQWATNCYPVSLREFIFKFRNNILGLNTRVSHFNNNVNRGCTFCTKNAIPVPVPARVLPDESFGHLFFDCVHTKSVMDNFFIRYLDHDLRDVEGQKKMQFTGMGPDFTEPNFFILTIMSIAMHYIWQCKLQKNLPSLEGLLNEIFFIGGNILKVSNTMRNAMNLNLPLCRNWAAESGRRDF